MGALCSLNAFRGNLRRLSKQKGFTLTILLTLGLCIGANIAIFAIVDAILLKPLPKINSAGLITAYNSYPGAGAEKSSASLPNHFERREAIDAFDSVSIIQYGSAIVGEGGSPVRVKRDRVSPEFFETLGVPLLMGRTFTEDEMLYANSRKAILTYGFWQSYFDGDQEVLGKIFDIEGYSNEVIAVLPQGFRFLSSKAQFYVPTASNLKDREPDNRHSNNFFFVARLKDGATVSIAQSQIDAFNAVLLETDRYASLLKSAGFRTFVKDLREDHVKTIKPTLLMLQNGVFCLLLIGGVNIANLFLIRANSRSKEMAVRQALGAGRGDIMRETLYETLTLTTCGGLLGIGVGALGIRLMGVWGIDKLPLGAGITLDSRVALVAVVGSSIVGIALAVPVVWFHVKGQLATALQAESRGGTVSRNAQRVRHGFIVAQIALTLILLSGAGMLSISLKRVMEVSPGFNPTNVVAGRISLPNKRYKEEANRLAFVDRLIPTVVTIPGVKRAAIITGLPFGNGSSDNATNIEGFTYNDENSIRTYQNSGVKGDYWKLMGIPLKEGRLLDSMDARSDTRVCVVDEDMAAFYWKDGESPLGKRLCSDPEFKEEEAFTIVGVVGGVKRQELGDQKSIGSIYYPYQHQTWNNFSLVLQSEIDPYAVMNTLRKTILNLDPELPIDNLKAMETLIDESLVTRRSPAILSIVFAGVALLLASIGTYGVLAFVVSQKQREVGVRMAIGASPTHIRWQFLLLGLRLLLLGLSIGVIGVWFMGRAVNGLLFEMPSFHFGSVLAATSLMTLVSQLACLLPSLRASRIPPTLALSEAGT